MPSRTVAIAVVVMVLLSGCSMFGGGGDDPEQTVGEAPGHHGFVFGSDARGNEFAATVTVSKDGETVFSERLESEGNGLYANLTTVNESGPYTVTVNTTLPAPGNENRSERTTVNGTLGNETFVDVTYQDIELRSFQLPREEMNEPLRFRKNSDLQFDTTIVVSHHGEVVYQNTVQRQGTGPFELTDLPEVGVYRVAVSGPDRERWANDTVILRNPDTKLVAALDVNDPQIRVYGPDESIPRNGRASLLGLEAAVLHAHH